MPRLLRFVIYTLVIAAICYSLPLIPASGDVTAFTENHPVEWTQFALLIVSAGIIMLAGWRDRNRRELFVFIGGLFLLAAFREQDANLEFVPWLGWKIGTVLVLPGMIAIVLLRWTRFRQQLVAMSETPAFALGWAGFIVAVPVSQLMGHGPFLEALLGEHYHRAYKHVIEESGELIGYLIAAFGVVEAAIDASGSRRPARA